MDYNLSLGPFVIHVAHSSFVLPWPKNMHIKVFKLLLVLVSQQYCLHLTARKKLTHRFTVMNKVYKS